MTTKTTLAKVFLAVALIGGLVVFAASRMWPSKPLPTLLFWCAVIGGGFLIIGVGWVFFNLQLRQQVLESGGKDPDWFFFPEDPPGMVALRKRWAKEQKEEPPR